MVFNIEQQQDNSGYETVQMGLSSGEVRQALLDYAQRERQHFTNHARLQQFVESLPQCTHGDPNEHVRSSIEELLYDHVTDDDLQHTVWQLSDQTLKVVPA